METGHKQDISDTVAGMAELLKAWNLIESRVKATLPQASAEKTYQVTAKAMNIAIQELIANNSQAKADPAYCHGTSRWRRRFNGKAWIWLRDN